MRQRGRTMAADELRPRPKASATITAQKKPSGRQPLGAVLVDGRWQLTEKSVQVAAERALARRESNRKRYQEMQGILRKERPELFITRGPRQTLLTEEVLPARSNERNGDLTRYQRDSSNTHEAVAPPHASTDA